VPINVQTEYPSSSAFSGTGQLDLGPFFISDVGKLLRHEVRGQVNSQGQSLTDMGVAANFGLWAVQWVPAGDSPSNIVTTVDGPQFPIREQMGTMDLITSWAPTSADGAVLASFGLRSFWAGQLPVNQSIDLYLSVKTPSGSAMFNSNLFASLRTWWS
jgi:hypothetical protein